MKFHDKMYQVHWHDTLSDFRSQRVLTDVTLVVDGQEFPVHKLVLSIFSPYFRVMFNTSSNFIESGQEKINLMGLDKGALEEILNFMYTSSIDINDDNVYALMDMSNFMQIHALKSFIIFYLEKSLTVENCLVFYAMGNLHQYFDFTNKAFNFIVTNFSSVLLRDEFLNITFDTLYKIVSSRLLEVQSEDKLVESILKWIRYDVDERKDHAESLFLKIDIEELSTNFLAELKNDSLVPCIIQEKIIKVQNSRSHSQGSERDKMPLCKRIRHKLERVIIFTIGGETSGMASGSTECFTAGYRKWSNFVPECVFKKRTINHTKVIPPLKLARYNAACASDGCNKIYVIGGENKSFILNECEVYDIRTNEWNYLNSYPTRLYGTGAAYMDNKLYVAGGYCLSGAINAAYVMDLNTEVWKEIPPLNKARSFHSVVAAGGYIFAIAGYDPVGMVLQCCERYDPSSNKWVKVADLERPRAKFGCAAVDEYIYVIGGTTFDCDSLKTVEKYNILTDEWTSDRPMHLPRHCLSATADDRDIYCIGGSNSLYALDSVDKFSLRTKRWHWEQSLQQARLSPCSAALKVPYFIE